MQIHTSAPPPHRVDSRSLRKLGVALFVAALAFSPANAQAVPRPTDESINIGGRSLHLTCLQPASDAASGPIVVIEAGAGMMTGQYAQLREAVTFTRVCSYERAGLGASDPVPTGRSFRDMADDLDKLLTAARIDGPLILVGHSIGGLIVRSYTRSHPTRVVAAVLIEASNETYNYGPLPTKSRADRVAILPAGQAGLKDELASFERTPVEMRTPEGFGDFGDRPLAVVRRGRMADPPSEDDLAWIRGQESLLALSTNSVLIVAKNSGHLVPSDEPLIAADAIQRVYNAIASKTRLSPLVSTSKEIR